MEYRLRPASEQDMESVYAIIDGRIRWMDQVGIRQWNTTDYWGVYPESHYLRLASCGELMVFLHEDQVVGVGALLREDPRWEDSGEVSAYYLHHFATTLVQAGVGSQMLLALEAFTKEQGKERLRLDCAVDNDFLNRYYEIRGYQMCGKCIDGVYKGNLREKYL